VIKKRFKINSVSGFAHLGCSLVSEASKFKCTIFLEYKGVSVNLKNSIKSIMDLISIRIKPGTYIEITAIGCDEQKALQTIENSLSQILFKESEKQVNCWTVSKNIFSSHFNNVKG
jgi:phosphocarrier protein HPr